MAKTEAWERIDPPQHVTLTLGAPDADGCNSATHNGEPVRVDFGIAGEDAVVELYEKRPGYTLGRVIDVPAPSATRVEPRCGYFGRCGGCQYQHIAYEEQLEMKRRFVRERLRDEGGLGDPPVSPAVGMDDPWAYRNHGRFSVNRRGNVGFTERHIRHFMRADACPIMHPQINETLAKLQGRCKGLSQMAMRVGARTGEMLIHPSDISAIEPSIASGQPWHHEEVLGRRFRINAGSFFQTNTVQAERLVELVRERLELSGRETVADAYAGVGMFAIVLAEHARRVIAIDESAAAIADARVNADGIDNVEFLEGKVERVLPELQSDIDALVLDPPRTGCERGAIDAALSLRPRRIVYVSCDPSPLARDLRLLVDGGYTLDDVTPVDMFPHTVHIESVATLSA